MVGDSAGGLARWLVGRLPAWRMDDMIDLLVAERVLFVPLPEARPHSVSPYRNEGSKLKVVGGSAGGLARWLFGRPPAWRMDDMIDWLVAERVLFVPYRKPVHI